MVYLLHNQVKLIVICKGFSINREIGQLGAYLEWRDYSSDILVKSGHHTVDHECGGDHRPPKKSPMVAWKSAGKSAKNEFYNRSTIEFTATYVDTRPTHVIVVQIL